MLAENYKRVKKILLWILLVNLIVAIIKLLIGYLIHSSSMFADGYHSLADASSNIIGLIGIHFAAKPEDEKHPYGHQKYETLAGIFISFMLFIGSIRVIIGAIEKFKYPIVPNISTESLILLIFTLIINTLISTFQYKKGLELNSQILISDSIHTKTDIYISVGVLATLLGVKLGLPVIIDPIFSIIVAVFILYSAYEIFKENGNILVDAVAIDADEIKAIVMKYKEVKGVHKIRSRGTLNSLFIDLHLLVDPSLDVEETHRLVHLIEDEIRSRYKNTQLIAHLEPFKD